jgi:hypothetical protein
MGPDGVYQVTSVQVAGTFTGNDVIAHEVDQGIGCTGPYCSPK